MIDRERMPAAAASVLLHGAVAAALLISWNFARDLKVGAVVPVTIVANAPSTDLKPAMEAPVEQTAMAETPVIEAPPEPAPPAPQPTPLPPTPTPTPTPKAAPPQPAPKAVKPAEKAPGPKPAPPTKADKGLDLDALSASVSKMIKPSGGKPANAPKGQNRAETAQQARPALGAGEAAAAVAGLAQELERRWNPNCEVEGGRDVRILATFQIGGGGQLVGDPLVQIQGAQTPVSQAAAERAKRAVYAASPFRNLPRDFYGQRVKVNFDARKACT